MKHFKEFVFESVEEQIRLTRNAVKRFRDEMAIKSGQDPNFGFSDKEEIVMDIYGQPVKIKVDPNLDRASGHFYPNTPPEPGKNIVIRAKNFRDVMLMDREKMKSFAHEVVHGLQHGQQIEDVLSGKLPRTGDWGSKQQEDLMKLLEKGTSSEKLSPEELEALKKRIADSAVDIEDQRYPRMQKRVPDLFPTQDSTSVPHARYLNTDIEVNARGVTDAIDAQDEYREMLANRINDWKRKNGGQPPPDVMQQIMHTVRAEAMDKVGFPELGVNAATFQNMLDLPSTVSVPRTVTPPKWLNYVSPKLYDKMYSYLRSPGNVVSKVLPPNEIPIDQAMRNRRDKKAQRAFERSAKKYRSTLARGLQMVQPDFSTPEKVQAFVDSYRTPSPTERALGSVRSLGRTIGTALDVLNPTEMAAAGVAGRVSPAAGTVAGMWGVADAVFGKEAQAPAPYDPNMEALGKEANIRKVQQILNHHQKDPLGLKMMVIKVLDHLVE